MTSSNHTQASGYQGQSTIDIGQLLEDTQSKEDAVARQESDMITIEVPSEQTMYYFTQPDHPIHPSVVIRSVVTGGDSIKIKTKGYTSGDQQLFEKWLKQFGQQDNIIKNNIN